MKRRRTNTWGQKFLVAESNHTDTKKYVAYLRKLFRLKKKPRWHNKSIWPNFDLPLDISEIWMPTMSNSNVQWPLGKLKKFESVLWKKKKTAGILTVKCSLPYRSAAAAAARLSFNSSNSTVVVWQSVRLIPAVKGGLRLSRRVWLALMLVWCVL